MKSEITQRSDTDATVKVSLSQAALDPMVKGTFDRLRTRVKAAGFRPGKAPDHIIERELGSAVVHDEVVEDAIKQSYIRAVKEHQLAAVTSPRVSLTKFVPYTQLEYAFTVALMPHVTLPDYSKIKAKPAPVKVDAPEVDRVIEDLRRRTATRRPAARAAVTGDEIKLDFEGTQNGKAVAGTSSQNFTLLLGSGVMAPGFEEQLVGVKAGETRQLKVKFPDDYQAHELQGQQLEFNVQVHEVTALDLPEADDQFAGEVSPHKTMADLRSDIESRILAEKTAASRREFENAVVDELIAFAQFALPQPMLDQQLRRLQSELADKLAAEGLDIDKYLQLNDLTPEKLDQKLRPEAERRVKLAVILAEAARIENLSVSADEVNSEHVKLKALYQDPQVQKELNTPQIKEEIYNHLLATRTINRILEKVEQAG
jgi:trigger factor